MCTVLLRLVPHAEWPVQLAFVRDEDRARPSDPPGSWWPHLPTVLGGRDARAGGTWLAVDAADTPAVALLTDQYDPTATVPDPAMSPTRGRLPLLVLERRAHFDLEADAPGGVDAYQPFHLVSISFEHGGWQVERWGWTGSELDHEQLAQGDHVIASRAPTIPGELQRRERLLDQLAGVDAGRLDSTDSTTEAWHDWPTLLDARAARPDDLDRLTIHSISARPGFGTVGASLVALSVDGRVRYDVNRTTTLDPHAWSVVHAPAVRSRS